MTCEELRECLCDYVGGELVIEHCRTVEVHLCECQRCVILVETYRTTVKCARTLSKCGRLPTALEARLRAAVEPHLPK